MKYPYSLTQNGLILRLGKRETIFCGKPFYHGTGTNTE